MVVVVVVVVSEVVLEAGELTAATWLALVLLLGSGWLPPMTPKPKSKANTNRAKARSPMIAKITGLQPPFLL